jgi:hypothetical protein
VASPLNLTFGSQADSSKIGNYKIVDSKNVLSLFGRYEDKNGQIRSTGQFIPYPISSTETGESGPSIGATSLHNEDMNSISIADIVKYTSDHPSMRLGFADFAYLKNVGVYPNNRLIIARRFSSPVSSDLTRISSTPMSTMISWATDEDFLNVTFGERWEDAGASFTTLLNSIGEEVKSDSLSRIGTLGNAAAAGFNALPFPGFMEGIQYQVMQKLGITTAGIGNSPLGNPNLIKMAKQRTLPDKNSAGSGLEAKFSIKMVVEYEQKFINGVDPTLVYLDIIQNALTFGTSDAAFQFNNKFAEGSAQIIKDLISGDLRAIARALITFVGELLSVIKDAAKSIIDNLVNPPKNDGPPNVSRIESLIVGAESITLATVGHVVSKYKIKLMGVVNALTGSPSTPWHVTIGNPKKPMFCSGDMLVESVDLTLGKTLAFNDLPSYIKIEFTLTNARPLGASEIFNRFNTGKARSYQRSKISYVENPDIDNEVEKQTGKVADAANQELKSNAKAAAGPSASFPPDTQSTNSGPTTQVNPTEDGFLVQFTADNGDDWTLGPVQSTAPVNFGEGASNNVTNNGDNAQPSASSTSTNPDIQAQPAPAAPPPPPQPTDSASTASAQSKNGYTYNWSNLNYGSFQLTVTNKRGKIKYNENYQLGPGQKESDIKDDAISEAKQILND